MATAPSKATDRYTIITADSHGGGSHAAYREHLDPAFLDDFDAWRGKYKNPFKDLGDNRRLRNWDNEMRNSQQLADGVVGEVIYPNTVPPFFPSFVLFAAPPRPEDYAHRLAGIRAHNRWLVEWCNEFPAQRAGVGQVFFNDIDDALEDLRFIKDNGLRGGVLIPNVPPDCTWVKPLFDRYYDPFWVAAEEMGVPVNAHGGTGVPDYGKEPVAQLLYITEAHFHSQRPFMHMLMGGVFERHPNMKFVMAEMGCAWLPPLLRRLDATLASIRDTGETGEIKYTKEHILPQSATDYFKQNCHVAVSQPSWADAAVLDELGIERFMWGSDYPHDEGTHPFTREHLRQLFHERTPAELHQILATNAAEMYEFSLDSLAPIAARYGPTVDELATPLDGLPDGANSALKKGLAGAVV